MMMIMLMIMMMMMMMMTTTTTTTTTTTNGSVKLESTHKAAVVGLSEYIKQGKDGLT
jgi:hypothetical protein